MDGWDLINAPNALAENLIPPPRKRGKNFKDVWFEEFPSWKEWVIKSSDSSKFICKYCGKTLVCGKSKIREHEATSIHQKKSKLFEKSLAYGIEFQHGASSLEINSSSEVLDKSEPSSSKDILDTNEPVASSSKEISIQSESLDSSLNNRSQDPNNSSVDFDGLENFQNKIKEAEVRIANFCVSKNLPFSIVNDMIELFRTIEPAVLNEVHLGRSKMTSVVNNVLCTAETERLSNVLSKNSFSVYIDETSDITLEKWLSIVVRYVEPETCKVRVELLQYVNLDASNCSAPEIFKAFENALCEKGIPLSNIVGLASDSANVMLGKNSSFKTKLLEKNKMVKVLPCVDHAVHNAAKFACSEIPDVEEIVEKIPSFLNASPKRNAIFRDICLELEGEYKKIPSHSATRWLVRHNCIRVIIRYWDRLLQFLTIIDLEDEKIKKKETKKETRAKHLLARMQKPLTLCYFHFLNYVLDKFNFFNATFQNRETLVQELQPKSSELFQWILSKYLKPGFLNPEIFFQVIKDVEFSKPTNQLALTQIDVGLDAMNYLKQKTLSSDQINEFFTKCVKFYVTASVEIRDRLPYNDFFLSCVSLLRPLHALCGSRDNHFPWIWQLCVDLGLSGSFEIETLKKEWYLLIQISEQDKQKLLKLSFDEMWENLATYTFSNGDFCFPKLTLLLNRVRTIPHSNAEAERAFSMLPIVKNKKRNSLGNSTVNSICVSRFALQSRSDSAITTEVTKRHLELMDPKNLYEDKSKKVGGAKMTLLPHVE